MYGQASSNSGLNVRFISTYVQTSTIVVILLGVVGINSRGA